MWIFKIKWKKDGEVKKQELRRESAELAMDSLQTEIESEGSELVEENLLELHLYKEQV